jgi:hypothetical protein
VPFIPEHSRASAELKESPVTLLVQAQTAYAAKDFVKAASLFGAVLDQEPANKLPHQTNGLNENKLMHSWRCALKKKECAQRIPNLPTKPKENSIFNQKGREEGAVKQAGPAASRSCEPMVYSGFISSSFYFFTDFATLCFWIESIFA